MNDTNQDTALQAQRGKLRAALADLKRLKHRRRPPPAAESPFKFVPTSFIEAIDWDAADRAPGPEGVSQFNWRLAAPVAPVGTAPPSAPASSAPSPAAEPEYEGVMERADFFLKEFDWQDEPEPAAPVPTADPMTDSRASASSFGDSFGWEEATPAAAAAAEPPAAPPTADAEVAADAAPATTDTVFTSFQWE